MKVKIGKENAEEPIKRSPDSCEARTSEYLKWYSEKDFGDLQSWKSEKTSKEKASGSDSILLKSLCLRKKKEKKKKRFRRIKM